MYHRKNSDDWHAKIGLGPYRHKAVRLCSDKATSETWRRLLQNAVDRVNAGHPADAVKLTAAGVPRRLLQSLKLVSPLVEKRRAAWMEHVEDYVGELRTAGRDAEYVYNARLILKKIGEGCNWSALRDVTRDRFAAYRASRRAAQVAARTINNETAVLRGFLTWCVNGRRLDENPVATISRIEEAGDRRRERRALADDEVRRLLSVAGPRELVYRTALVTALRAKELGRLQWRDVHVEDRRKPYIELRAEATKAKRADVLPIAPALAARLKDARPADALPHAPVFASVPMFMIWKADLERAGIPYRDGDGRIAGFHSLRVTRITAMQRCRNMTHRERMALARHTDPRLTDGPYTDLKRLDLFGAVGHLPDYEFPVESAAAVLNGTFGAPDSTHQIRAQEGPISTHSAAPTCSEVAAARSAASAAAQIKKTPEMAVSGRSRQVSTTRISAGAESNQISKLNWGTRIRT